MDLLKQEKGSITLFVVISMLFFIMFLTGMYMLSATAESGVIEEQARIKEIYEQGVNDIDNVYATLDRENSDIYNLKVGDYVVYDSGENGNITCRVLYKANSPYGLQVISDKTVKEVTIGVNNDFETSKEAYNNVIETLNNEALLYKNEKYALDARCVGSNPNNKNAEVLGPITMQFEYNGSNIIDYKNEDNNYETDQKAMKEAGLWSIQEPYWLASRSIDSVETYCDFLVHIVNKEGELSRDYMGGVNSKGGNMGTKCYNGLRPCITLNSYIVKIIDGNGTSEQPYILGI